MDRWDDPGGRTRRRRPGRHRRDSRRTGPLVLAIAVTALLGVGGAGAALLPDRLAGAADDERTEQTLEAAAPPRLIDPPVPAETSAEPTTPPPGTPTPDATTASSRGARPTTAAPPTPNRRTSTPASRRTATRTTSPPSTAGNSEEARVLAIVNRERAANGCNPVVLNSKLSAAAQAHSEDQAAHTTMSHTGSDGSSFVDRARRAGYDSPIGENVAMGYPTPEAVMEGWMNSSGHRANILNCRAAAMGVGVATGDDGRLYWTQVFGSTA